MKGLLIAGTHSGAGKTTVTLGLMAVLRRRGLTIQPFKAGPDYIDPGYHRIICDRPPYNLDTWMMGEDRVKRTFYRVMEGADIGIMEGVMGLFDSNEGGEDGSTAHLAKVLGLPVMLVVDARGLSRSAGAIVYGFERFDPGVDIAGVIFNRVGGERHFKVLKEAVRARCRVKVLGYIPRDEDITIPHRHLGLMMAEEPVVSDEWSVVRKRLVELVERFVDIEGVLKIVVRGQWSVGRAWGKGHGAGGKGHGAKGIGQRVKTRCPMPHAPYSMPYANSPLTTRIAVALDNAFCFYYQENLDILEGLGAELVFFSPLKDRGLPDGIRGIYIGGGYPELYAKALESNKGIRKGIKEMAERGLPIYAECGGLMYLGEGLRDLEGKTCEMVGVFPWTARMLERRRSLGYREIVAMDGCPFIEKGQKVRGHEFHYSEIDEPPPGVKRVYRIINPKSKEGYLYKNTLASYVHLHFASNPMFAQGFVEFCRLW